MTDEEWREKVGSMDAWELLREMGRCHFMFGDPYYRDLVEVLLDRAKHLAMTEEFDANRKSQDSSNQTG